MEKYIPDIYQENIYKINYDSLILRGIKCIFFDLDNTLIKTRENTSSSELKKLIRELKKLDFTIFIVSNNFNKRVKKVADELKVKFLCYAEKPKTEKVLKLINSTKFKIDEIAIIGDSMHDDVVCGNVIGITTILTDQLDKHEFPFAKIKRIKERHIQKKLKDHDLFTKGRYYE